MTLELSEIPPARLPFPVTRAVAAAPEIVRADGEMPTMSGHFSTFSDFYEVDSLMEGHFLEQIAPGAFRKTIRKSNEDRGAMKVLYDHGQDPQIGNKVLGPIESLKEDSIGPAYSVPLLDTTYNRDLVPGLEAGLYGSSFRFTVEGEEWDRSPKRSKYNPDGIPERTITEVRVYEFGPVTFPANPNATAGARSTTDTFYRRSRDPEAFETLLRSAQNARTLADPGAAAPSEPPHEDTPPEEPPSSDTPPEPPPAEPVPEPQDPPDGGSSDSRSATVDYITRDDKASRVTELEESIKTRATAYPPGQMPAEEKAADKAEKEERETLILHIAEWDERQAYVASLLRKGGHEDEPDKPENTRGGYRAPEVNVTRQVDPYDFGEVENRGRSTEHRNQLYRDNAMRITEQATFPNPNTDVQASRDKMAWLLDYHDSPDKELARRFMATASPLYRRAFNKLVLGQQLSPEEQRGTALAVGVDATGGFAIPVVFDLSVIAIGSHSGAINPYRRACRVVPIVGTDTYNALTATAVTATRTTEAAPAIEQGPTFAQPQYIVKRVQAQITYSLEVAQDRTDISSEMAVLIQEAKDNEEENQFAVGVGTTVFPLGVGPVNGTSGAYTSLTTSTSVTLLAADVDLVEAALPVRHRFNAQWFLNRSSIRRLQTLEILGGKLFGGNGYYPAVQSNVPNESTGNTGLRLIGYPVNESPSLPTATTANIVIGTLLNVDSYVIVDRIGMNLQIIPFIFGASQGNLVTGQQALYAMWRNDARPINVDAGRTLRYLT